MIQIIAGMLLLTGQDINLMSPKISVIVH